MRGNGDSQGLMADEYWWRRTVFEPAEVIDWIVAQPWSNGSVGMMGISWGGFNALQVAAMRPAPLKAIIILCSTVDRYADDIHYKGGWGDAYKNAVPRLVANLSSPVKGIVGPWVHKYPHLAVPEPRIGFLKEALRWWDRWLHDKPTGVEDDPAYRVYLMDGVRLASWYDNRPRRWVADPVTEVQVLPLGKGVLGRAEKFTQTLASPAHCGAQGALRDLAGAGNAGGSARG